MMACCSSTTGRTLRKPRIISRAIMERSDYYLRDAQEMPGQWHGLGAELLGLSGTVDKERYFQLCDNINPATGERLTPHNKGNRRILYDFTFDAPKSVSL